MSWLNKFIDTDAIAQRIISLLPTKGPVDVAREFMSEAVAERIRGEACTKAYELLAKAHREVIRTIIWQNALLLVSLLPVYMLHSPWPFYVAYAAVAGYSIYAVGRYWPQLVRLVKARSITGALAAEVQAAMETELTQRQFYERKAVEWLGPDLKRIADDVAKKLKPDVVAAASNMAITLFLAFIAFRLFVIPLLEHRAMQ